MTVEKRERERDGPEEPATSLRDISAHRLVRSTAQRGRSSFISVIFTYTWFRHKALRNLWIYVDPDTYHISQHMRYMIIKLLFCIG